MVVIVRLTGFRVDRPGSLLLPSWRYLDKKNFTPDGHHLVDQLRDATGLFVLGFIFVVLFCR